MTTGQQPTYWIEMIEIDSVPRDEAHLRQAYACFPSGVTAVCALIDGEPVGMAASSFTSVSLDPPLVSVCVRNVSATWRRLRGSSRLGVSVLAEDHDMACRTLSLKDGDRFAGIAWESGPDGVVLVNGSAAWLVCSVREEVPAGDHVIVVMSVHGLQTDFGAAPLVFHGSRFRRLAEF
ncbi:flavin reductase family protein [Streptomyces sp. NPDC059568]|uniref:flavin reductase family protein n=1 Tax=Streptomyces sp. NPDC059568 TaxID=3346868 RepID=UPI0036B29549